MENLDTIIVGLILTGAVLYLYKVFKPKKNGGGGCGCGTADCKVPKTKIKPPTENGAKRQK